jgi:hypothetical protein
MYYSALMKVNRRRIRADVKKEEALTTSQASEIQQKRMSLQKRIAAFRRLQTVYMPGVAMKLAAENARHDGPQDIEDVRLWFPSELDSQLRTHGCHKGLSSMEEQLREAQCRDALDKIWNLERAKMHFIHHRNSNTWGQKAATRSHTLIDGITQKIQLTVSRYRNAHKALVALREPGDWETELRVLKDEDICSPNASAFDIENPDDLIGPDGRLKTKKRRKEIEKQLGEGRRVMSWIWFNAVGTTNEAGEKELNEGMSLCFLGAYLLLTSNWQFSVLSGLRAVLAPCAGRRKLCS